MAKLLKLLGKEGTHGRQFIGQPLSHRMKAALVEPPAKEEAPKPFDFSLPPELKPSRYEAFKTESSLVMKRFLKWLFWKDTYRIEKTTEYAKIGDNRSMKFMPTGVDGGQMVESSEPVCQEYTVSSTRIPVRRLRLPFRLAGTALLVGTLGWGAGYCMGFPPPQRLLIESQRKELYQNMELRECWERPYSQDFIFSESLDMLSKVRCAERKYSEAHRND